MTQAEADFLIKVDKRFDDTSPLDLAAIKWTRELSAVGASERFLLDYNQGWIALTRYSHQMRHGATEILLRYCSGVRHTNPQNPFYVGTFDGPHVHLYKEGYDDKIAFPSSQIGISNPSDHVSVLAAIMKFCHVVEVPPIQRRLIP